MTRLRADLPTVIVARLPEWLRETGDATMARRAFVRALERWAPALQDAECVIVGAQRLFPRGTAAAAEAALARIGRLGLLAGEAGGDLAALPATAGPMNEARVVEVTCGGPAAKTLFLVLAMVDRSFQVVALESSRPEPERGPPRSGRIALAAPPGVVSPFVPVAEDGL